MKILLCTEVYLPGTGGTERVVAELARTFCKEHDVLVAAPSYGKKCKKVDRDEPFKITRCPRVYIPSSHLALPCLSPKFKRTIKKFEPTIIHIHGIGGISKYALKYAKKHNVPVLYTGHTKLKQAVWYITKQNWVIKHVLAWYSKNINKCDHCVCVSGDLAKEMQSIGITKNIEIVKNGTHFSPPENLNELKSAANEKYNLADTENVFCYVGRLVKEKRLDFTLNALARVKQTRESSKQNTNFKFLVVGDGPSRAEFSAMATKLGLKDNVLFLGEILNFKTLCEIYARSDLFLFPSDFDNDPLTVVEAAVNHTPSLVLEKTGSSERIIDDLTGFMVKDNIQDFTDKILQLMNNKAHTDKCGSNASRMIPKTWNQAAQEYLRIYTNLSSQKS